MTQKLSQKLKDLKKLKPKKVVDISNLPQKEKEAIAKSSAKFTKGAGCGKLFEPIPKYIKAKCEKVVKGDNNTFLVFGRDRPKSVFSGYGGKGHTGAGSIDIVTGRMSCLTPRTETDNGEAVFIDPDFVNDAARVYISQKTNVDDNFNIDGIPKVPDSVARSAVALKADDIRLLARETIKLCTAMDPLNSQNGSIQSVGGIYLIAGSAGEEGDQVQSIARGENTASAIDALIIEVLALKNAFHGFVEKQSEFNSNVASHTHHSPFFGKPTLPSQVLTIKGPKTAAYHWEKTINSLVALSNNIAVVQDNYLQKNGPHYVGSRHNKTN